MKRTTATGNASNLYTEGNPSLGVPATVVGADEMNNIQEEICNVVEAAGITLDGNTKTQLLAAIGNLINLGGQATGIHTIVNNQSSAQNLTGLLFDAANIAAVQIQFAISRVTSTTHLVESGTIHLAYDSAIPGWRISVVSEIDDAGVKFEITAQGQLTYKSTNVGGTSYVGKLRIGGVKLFKNS